MVENDSADDAVSRRSVLEGTSGLIAGATALAGLSTGAGAAETGEGLRIETREMTEEYVIADVRLPEDHSFDSPSPPFLGLADRFVVHEDGEWVSLPEDTDGLARPVEAERLDEGTYRMYFRTGDVDWPDEHEEGEEVTLGLGVFPERTVQRNYWDTTSITGPWGDPY